MSSFFEIFTQTGTASTLLFLAVVGAVGIFIGKAKIGSLKLGIAGVLFVGLLVGHLGAHIDHGVLHFVKEFGLILFVYSIGIEIGPRFLSSLRNNGMRLNLLAAMIVLLGLGCAFAIKFAFNLNTEVVAGLFSGAVTNTPSLGAVQSLITDQFENGGQLAEVSGMAYAVAYPFGILGIILAMASIRLLFKIKTNQEIEDYKGEQESVSGNIQTIRAELTNPNLFGQTLATLAQSIHKEFVVSRILKNGEYVVPEANMILEKGDIIIGLCSKNSIQDVELVIGKTAIQEKFQITGELSMRHILMTNRKLAGKTLRDINLSSLFPANVTRVFRGETEIIPSGETTLEFGDTIRVVGRRAKMDVIANFLGNSLRDLSHPNLIPLFIGVFLGILLGSIPIFIPGLPAPAKLGLAGGPLIIALILGHKGRIGHFDFYMTPSANHFIREMGIVLFLGCVGIGSGKGSMTDPPALEFANNIAPVQAQATAYATVYPLTMFLRILMAQLLVLLMT